MRVADGAEISAVDRTWRIVADAEHGWRLQDQTPEGWRDLYVFDDTPAYPSDIEAANFWICGSTQSPFVGLALIVKHTPTGRVTLLNRTARRHEGNTFETEELQTRAAFERYIHEELGLDIKADAEGWQTLWQKVGGESMPIDW